MVEVEGEDSLACQRLFGGASMGSDSVGGVSGHCGGCGHGQQDEGKAVGVSERGMGAETGRTP